MKNSHIAKLMLTICGVILVAGVTAAQAADSGGVIREYDVVVPPAQDHAFREGIEHWQKCLRDHGSSQAVYVYDAATGDQSHYAFLLPHASWSDIDRHTAAGKACYETFVRSVAPHATDDVSAILQVNAKATYDPHNSAPTTPLWWVQDYRIKPGKFHEFMGVAHAFAAAAAKTGWEAYFVGYDVMAGGKGSPQFLLVMPNESWAEAGMKPNPSTRKMMESVYGKSATAALYRELAHTIRSQWSGIWSYDKELSFVPAKTH